MRPPVHDRMQTTPPDASLGAAGADETEADPSQTVAAYPAVVDAEGDTAYGYAMEQRSAPSDDTRSPLPSGAVGVPPLADTDRSADTLREHGRYDDLEPNDWHRPDDANAIREEAIRQSRLSRWQAQR